MTRRTVKVAGAVAIVGVIGVAAFGIHIMKIIDDALS